MNHKKKPLILQPHACQIRDHASHLKDPGSDNVLPGQDYCTETDEYGAREEWLLVEEIERKTAPVPLCLQRTRHKKSLNPMLCGEEPACNWVKAWAQNNYHNNSYLEIPLLSADFLGCGRKDRGWFKSNIPAITIYQEAPWLFGISLSIFHSAHVSKASKQATTTSFDKWHS
jgi:hypothetical protein